MGVAVKSKTFAPPLPTYSFKRLSDLMHSIVVEYLLKITSGTIVSLVVQMYTEACQGATSHQTSAKRDACVAHPWPISSFVKVEGVGI